MSLGPDEVKNIAHLARLNIDESSTDALAENLSSILDLVAQMNEVDTSDVSPMAHPQDIFFIFYDIYCVHGSNIVPNCHTCRWLNS